MVCQMISNITKFYYLGIISTCSLIVLKHLVIPIKILLTISIDDTNHKSSDTSAPICIPYQASYLVLGTLIVLFSVLLSSCSNLK
jgi:hypothetical protein